MTIAGKARGARWLKVRWWSALVLVLVVAVTGCGKSKGLATQVDDLLKAGRITEANQKLASELPDLVRQGETGQVDDVASVVRARTSDLNEPDALSLQRSSFQSYFEGVSDRLSSVPPEQVCSVVVRAQVPPSQDASLQEVLTYVRERQQRESAAEYCELLGIQF